MFETKIQSIIHKLNAALDDARKVDKGQTGTPGTRLRKTCSDATKDLKHVRELVIEQRGTDEG